MVEKNRYRLFFRLVVEYYNDSYASNFFVVGEGWGFRVSRVKSGQFGNRKPIYFKILAQPKMDLYVDKIICKKTHRLACTQAPTLSQSATTIDQKLKHA